MKRSLSKRAGASATLGGLMLVVLSLGGQPARTAVEWRFDEPQPGWTASVPRPFPPDIQPPTVSRTDDALRVTLGPSNAIRDGRLLGGVHVDVPAWDHRDWAYVEIRARSSGPGGVTLGFNVWDREGHPQEGLPRPYEMRGLPPTRLVEDDAVRTYQVPFQPRDPTWQDPVNQLALWFNTLGDSLTVDILSVTVVPAGASGTAPPSATAAARPDPWIMAAVPFAPIPFASDAGTALVYELHVNNLSARDVTLRRVDVLSRNGDRLRSYEGSLLAPNLQRVGASARQEGSLVAAGSLAVVWVWLIVEEDAAVPDVIRHQLTVEYGDEGTADSIVVEARPVAPRAHAMEIGPPLRGGGWKAGGISESEGHRRGLYDAGDVLERFATDYSRVDQFGRGSTGDPFVLENNHGFGADVLAVGDGVVISAHDGMPESAVGQQPPRRPPASLGNYVKIDLGDGVTASYLHLQSGSVGVQAGDTVTRGQVIARVGNSGATAGPHLHFQLNDATGEGIPYVHPAYERTGVDGIPYCRCSGPECTATPPVRRARQMPTDDVVVRFPDGPDGLLTESAVAPARMSTICRVREAERLVEADRIGDALDAYADARALDSSLIVPGAAWRRLCWLGTLSGRAAEVLSACELAVAQEPGYGSHLSPRGVARALTGDRAGAIEDLEAYLAWEAENRRSAGYQGLLDGLAAGASLRPQIQGWLDALRAGDDPFTPELLEELRRRTSRN